MVRIVTLLVAVVAGNQERVFAPRMSIDAKHVNTGGRSRVFASLLSVSATLLLFLLLPSFFVGDITVFRPRKMWGLV